MIINIYLSNTHLINMNAIINKDFMKRNTYIMIQFGELINKKCYKVDLGEKNFMDLLEYISSNIDFDKVEIEDEKHYYSGDMKLVMDIDANMKCIKYKYNNYDVYKSKTSDFRIINYSYQHINPNYFPGTTEYNDVRKLNKMSFYKNNVVMDMKIITYLDKYITYEVDIYTKSDNHKELINLMNELQISLPQKVYERHFDNYGRISKTIH
jgi:hypothetical protein